MVCWAVCWLGVGGGGVWRDVFLKKLGVGVGGVGENA